VRIPSGEIRTIGRASKGVRIMNLNNGDRITGVARLVEVEMEKTAVTVEDDIENKADGVLTQVSGAIPPESAAETTDVEPDDTGETTE